MTAFFSWYFIVTLLGWLTFPLAYALFPALADRGYTLSRAAGFLIWGYVFWLFASLGIAPGSGMRVARIRPWIFRACRIWFIRAAVMPGALI